ncbi:MAG: glycosyltransferase [Chitinivibrionales bacterium]|nr:glycosyltransferase [Chitinivibrionales bacterium]MBD3356326.1 glycosyltransferase [Chitinivibrionales bacterium]
MFCHLIADNGSIEYRYDYGNSLYSYRQYRVNSPALPNKFEERNMINSPHLHNPVSDVHAAPQAENGGEGRSAPLRFLQIHPFYPAALATLYQNNPTLASASFDQQIEAIVKDGFSGIHLFGAYMNCVGYDSRLIVLNNPPSQEAWLREHDIEPDRRGNRLLQAVIAQIETIRPDILYLSEPIGLDSKFVRSLSYRPSLVIGWRAANVPDGTDWSAFDLILSNLEGMRHLAVELGAKAAEHFFPGFPEWMAEEITDVRPEVDVVFCGQASQGQHVRRNHYLDYVARASMQKGKQFSCRYFLSGDAKAITPVMAAVNAGTRYGIHMHRGLRTGRIGLDARGSIGLVDKGGKASMDLARKETSNMRIFETTGSGVFLLTEYHDNLSRYFEPGKEVATFTDKNDLVDTIRYYLAHPDQREEIARRGRERCLREYSMARRCEAFDAIIKKHLGSKANHGTAATHPPLIISSDAPRDHESAQVVREAFACLNADNNEEALCRLDEAIAGLQYAKAVALARLGREREARDSLHRILDSFPAYQKARTLAEELAAKAEQRAEKPPRGQTVCKAVTENAEELLNRATKAVEQDDYVEAFKLLNIAKALRQPVEGLDLARATVFVKAKQILAAREALLEELRLFPANSAARSLLEKIEELTKPLLRTELGNDEFKNLYRIIRPHTMLQEHRLFSLYSLARKACEEDIPGNFIECGVAAGGGSALLAWTMKRYTKRPRLHFALDTFEGMPDPTAEDTAASGIAANDTGWGAGTCAAPLESLEEVCRKLNVGDLVRPIKGRFQDTLAANKQTIGNVAVLHLDADWYESTRTVLSELYNQITENGYVQFDDYGGWSGCRKAIDEFQRKRSISFNLQDIDGTGVWMTKRAARVCV